LTSLGRKQAELLGRRLVRDGFGGKIYSSPYLRTTETAQTIAEVTGSVVLPALEMREYVIREHQMDDFKGATLDDLIGTYSRVQDDRPLQVPWWTTEIETDEDIEKRVRPLIDEVSRIGDDVLLVGHGASVAGVHRRVIGQYAPTLIPVDQVGWNCMLSSFRTNPDFEIIHLMDVDHLPDDYVTNNAMTRDEILAERRKE
jgi:broad specificity phosphatase PhoE